MSQQLDILNGCYTATLVKGKWQYSPNMDAIKKSMQPKPKKESLKEKPQFAFIEQAEKESVQRYQSSLHTTAFEITQFLKGTLEEDVDKSANDYFEKGGRRAVIGEIRTFGGRQYIRTIEGWKFYGKGTGEKANQHRAGTVQHSPHQDAPKKVTIESPNGVKVTGPIETLPLKDIHPSEPHALDAENDTARGYAEGIVIENQYERNEKVTRMGKLTSPEQLPPALLSKDGYLLDGNNRYNAVNIAGLTHMRVVRSDKTYKEFYGIEPELKIEVKKPLTAEDMLSHPETKRRLKDIDHVKLWKEQFLAKTKNYKPNTYYRVEGTGLGYTGVGVGMYVGRDKRALKNFYDIEGNNLPIREFHGEPKWLDLMDYSACEAFEKEAIAKFGKHEASSSDHMRKLAIERGYDGIRYYDPSATGEEFVLFNTDKLKRIK